MTININTDLIDEHHKEWISLYKETQNLLVNSVDKDVYHENLTIIIAKMYEYSRSILRDEEHFLESVNYSHLIQHRMQHRELDRAVTNLFIESFIENTINGEKTLKIIENWLINHILNQDKKYEVLIFKHKVEYKQYFPLCS